MTKKGPKANHSSKEKNKTAIYVALIGAAALIVVAIITELFGLLPKPPPSVLEITSLTPKNPSLLDVKVRNIGPAEALITELTVSILRESGTLELTDLGPLPSSGQYNLSVAGLQVGQSTSVQVSHSVGANKADRFLVGLANNTRRLIVKLTITYNRDQIVSETVYMMVIDVTKNIPQPISLSTTAKW